MNRTIKDATVKRYHYDSHEQLRRHLQLFIDAYNHARRLKTLHGLTPYEYIAKIWTIPIQGVSVYHRTNSSAMKGGWVYIMTKSYC